MSSKEISVSFNKGAVVSVCVYTNAAFDQKVTIKPPNKSKARIFEGNGENHLLAHYHFTASDGSYVICIENKQEGESWKYSKINSVQSQVGRMAIHAIQSEDSTDHDWNDSVVLFIHWN